MLYRSLVGPYLRYCCPVWGSCSASAHDKLQKLQHRAASVVTDNPYDMSALPLMKNLGWLTVREMIDFDINKMINKSLNAIAPDYLRNIFQSVSEATNLTGPPPPLFCHAVSNENNMKNIEITNGFIFKKTCCIPYFQVANDFVSMTSVRYNNFGTFIKSDL